MDQVFVCWDNSNLIHEAPRLAEEREGTPDAGKIRAAIDDLKAFQKTHDLGGLSVRQMIESGRRH